MKTGCVARGLLCGAALSLAVAPAPACGPDFPASYLEGEGGALQPHIDFAFALLDIAATLPPDAQPPGSFAASGLTTLEAGVADLAACLAAPEAAAQWSRDQRRHWLQDYRAVAAQVHAGQAPDDPVLPDLPSALSEFALYLRGAADLLAHNDQDYWPAAWRELMNLPPAQRRHRTAWVVYMRGTCHARFGRPGEAAACYAQLRGLLRDGWPDSLGLAYASIRREYLDARTLRERMVAAPRALARYAACPDLSAYHDIVLDLFCRLQQAELGDAELDALLRDPVAREVMVAFHANRHYLLPAEKTERLLAHLPPQPMRGAERAAFVAHLQGQDARARQWLAAAPRNGLIALWLTAGYQREAGNYPAAAETYRTWLREFERQRDSFSRDENRLGHLVSVSAPPRPAAGVQPAPLFIDWGFDLARRMDEEVYAQLGGTLVYRRDFLQAMDCFLRAHAWVDAAYLAENVISTAELERYVNAQTTAAVLEFEAGAFDGKEGENCWHADPLVMSREPAEGKPSPDPLVAQQAFLRYLLGRRLVREGRIDAAVTYLPPAHQPPAARLAQWMKVADDAKRAPDERALACYNAARILRWRGMELSGTELQPDSRYVAGQYTFGLAPAVISNGILPQLPFRNMLDDRTARSPDPRRQASAAEIAKVVKLLRQDPPEMRFHYRLRAAGLMWRGAELARDPRLKALALYAGGFWVRDRQYDVARLFAEQCGRLAAPGNPAAQRVGRGGWFTTLMTPWMKAQMEADVPELRSPGEIPAQLFRDPAS